VDAAGSISETNGGFLCRGARRGRLFARLLTIELVLWFVLRLVLVAVFRDASATVAQLAGVVAAGAATDLVVGLTALLPLCLVMSIFRLRWLSRPRPQHGVVAFAAFALTFDAFVQYFFFEEYDARYNHLALDYLLYPTEVLGNIFASYNVPLFLGLAAAIAAGLTYLTSRLALADFADWRPADRIKAVCATCGLAALLWGAWLVLPEQVAANRVTNELALNGWTQLLRAYGSSHLDYEVYYAMVPGAEAAARVARLLGYADDHPDLVRHFPARGRPQGAPLDVVIILEESLGSSFSARFGHASGPYSAVTPELDRWSREGLALTNLVANGNRTVRGLEGVLCSFLPLPGDSIVKRDRSENVASIARVLAAQGYQTTFVYGGYGRFDNVKPFMLANGFQTFVEQSDYPPDAFRTIWGVADEIVLDEMIARQQAANRLGRHWFGTALTVSNHKPFAVPPGRVTWPTEKSHRRGAMLYADWALGRYLTKARQAHLLDHTVVLVVGDHGARVYGSERIPVTSYRIPAVILTPDPAYRGAVIDRLASQVDLAPTLLSLAGVAYDAPFFGQDLIDLPATGGRAFVNHNRSIGLLTDTALVVLELHRSLAFYTRPDRRSDTFTAVTGETPTLRELARDTEAMFQTAYKAYRDRTFRLSDGTPASPTSPSGATR
jgi:phosphoglycerol transferase MdoB-like AlkP superfamily enzyme